MNVRRLVMVAGMVAALGGWAQNGEDETTESPEYQKCLEECRASDHQGCEGVCREDESPSCAVGAVGLR